MARPELRFYQEAEARPHLVYEICKYRHGSDFECNRCPAWENVEGHGLFKRACYGLAVELIAKVLEDTAIAAIELPDSLKPKPPS